jgi:hypothetical protein
MNDDLYHCRCFVSAALVVVQVVLSIVNVVHMASNCDTPVCDLLTPSLSASLPLCLYPAPRERPPQVRMYVR